VLARSEAGEYNVESKIKKRGGVIMASSFEIRSTAGSARIGISNARRMRLSQLAVGSWPVIESAAAVA
jgi:hypothetical protein